MKFTEKYNTINESDSEITNREEFESFVHKKLKKAHPDDYDEDRADKIIKGLTDKYAKEIDDNEEGIWGKLVGIINKSCG